jgi:hypothetical protein
MITTEDVLRIFHGGYVVRLDLECPQCKALGRVIKAVWPNRERWQCHFCGREAESKTNAAYRRGELG